MSWHTLASSYGTGRMAPTNGPTQGGVYAIPRTYKRDQSKPAIICFHGAGGTARSCLSTPSLTGQYFTYRNLASLTGCPVLAHDFGGAFTWGRKTGGSAPIDAVILEVIAWAESATLNGEFIVGAKPGPHVFMGASMGGLNICQFAKDHVANVGALVGLIPVSDTADLRNFDRPQPTFASMGFRASFNGVYGLASNSTGDYPTHGSSLVAMPANANPTTSPGLLATIPARAYASSDDPIVPFSTVQTLWGDVMGGEVFNVGALGHTEAAIGAPVLSRLVNWLRDVEAV